MSRTPTCFLVLALLAGGLPLQLAAQTAPAAQAPAVPHATGTVKSVSASDFVLTVPTGEVTVTVPAAAKVLVVAPGSKDLKSATAGTLADVTAGDRAIVNGTAGDSATAMTATRVILMKSSAIAQSHAADEAAWAQGGGGIVKSVDPATGAIVVSSGLKTLTVQTSAKTVVRHYAGDSVRFQDAVLSTLAGIRPGDQLRVRGTKSADGATVQADEIVTGSFRNFSGLITAIDAAAGTITLKDLATKKTVVVAVTPNSDVHRLPPEAAQRIAAGLKGGGAPAAGAAPAAAGEGQRRASRAGSDLSSMLARLPTETLGGLKQGEAVMIVATSPSTDSGKSTAVTLLVGVDAILSASPSGETMTLSPWNVGGGGGDASGAGGS